MKTDYPELEGKEIKIRRSESYEYPALIGGVSYHIGITLVDPEIRESIFCLRSPDSILRATDGRTIGTYTRYQYRKQFHHIVAQLKTGIFDIEKDTEYEKEITGEKSSGTNPATHCPFK